MIEPSAVVGHVLVPKDGTTDAALHLADDDWSAFYDAVPVSEDAWLELDAARVLDAFQQCADGIVGRYEEAWVKRPELLASAARAAIARASPRAQALLQELARLADVAKARGTVVIFAID